MSENTSETLLPALHPATISGPAPEPVALPSTEAGESAGAGDEQTGAGAEGAATTETPEQKAAAEQAAAQEKQRKSAAARIGAAVRAQREAERQVSALQARVQEMEAKDPAKAAEALTAAQIDLKAAEKAQQMLQAQAIQQKAQAFQTAGETEFPDDWNDKCNAVAELGAAARKDFVPILLDIDGSHRAIAAMADDPELTEKILKMPAHKMAIEIAKLAEAPKPKSKPVSKAPDPITKTGGVARSDGYRSNFTVAEHVEWAKKNAPYNQR
jgi:hypothetical protein